MNLGTMRSKTRRLSGLRMEALLSDADLDGALNESYRELAGLYSWPFLRFEETVTLAAGEAVVALPFEMRVIGSVSLPGSRLRQVTVDELDRLDDGEPGAPSVFCRLDDRRLRLWPVPEASTSVTVRGQLRVSELEAENDAPVFEPEFHTVVVYRTAARLLAEEGDDSGRTAAYLGEAQAAIARMLEHYMGSGDTASFVMGGNGRRRRGLR